jgi:molybdate transport system substrate-binding protein
LPARDADAAGGLRGLRVLAAGALRPAFDLLAHEQPGGLRLEYANGRDLADRIAAGEPADVFASVSVTHPRALYGAGIVDQPRPFAANRLVVAVPIASGARSCSVLVAPGTRVVIEAQGVPLGDYTRQLLALFDERAARDFSARALANVVAQERCVDDVAARLLDGDADAGVLYATDVAARSQRLRAIELPWGMAVAVTCVACAVETSPRRERASAWVQALLAPPAQTILMQAGFRALEGAASSGARSRGHMVANAARSLRPRHCEEVRRFSGR